MSYKVLVVPEFSVWFSELAEAQQIDITATIGLLEARGVTLGFPHSSSIRGSRYGQMRELRIQSKGKPLRVLYAFDPLRQAVLLLGGDKTGDDRWYKVNVPLADKRYGRYLEELTNETRTLPPPRQTDDDRKGKKGRRR